MPGSACAAWPSRADSRLPSSRSSRTARCRPRSLPWAASRPFWGWGSPTSSPPPPPRMGPRSFGCASAPRRRASGPRLASRVLAAGPGHTLEPLLITLEPGGRSGKHPSAPGREEFMFVVEGELIVTVGPDDLLVQAGDAIVVRPREVRRYQNPGPGAARILVVGAPPSVSAPPKPKAKPGPRRKAARPRPTRRRPARRL